LARCVLRTPLISTACRERRNRIDIGTRIYEPALMPKSARFSGGGTSIPRAEYSVILFRNVRTDTPSKRAVAVRFPLVLASVSKTKSRSMSRMGKPTSHRVRRRRDEAEIGARGIMRPIALLHFDTPPPSSGDDNKVNEFLTMLERRPSHDRKNPPA
jgi:hypothetical protein